MADALQQRQIGIETSAMQSRQGRHRDAQGVAAGQADPAAPHIQTEHGTGHRHRGSAATKARGGQRLALGTQAAEHPIQRAAELHVAGGCLTTPKAATEEQLLLSPPPTLAQQQLRHRSIIQGGHQAGAASAELNAPQHGRQGLIEARIPGHIAHQLKLASLAPVVELHTARQHRFTGQQDATAGTAAVEQIKPMAIGDLTQVTEAAPLLERPKPLGIPTVDRLPGQPRR